MSNTSDAAKAAREPEESGDGTEQQVGQATAEVVDQADASDESSAGIIQTGQPKPDVSDQDSTELLPKLFDYFHNNREELARALGVHRSTVDRWFNGTSRPNNSTLLRMRRVAQERRIE